jgi:hypothetical protein
MADDVPPSRSDNSIALKVLDARYEKYAAFVRVYKIKINKQRSREIRICF